jgi:hypothetical protein
LVGRVPVSVIMIDLQNTPPPPDWGVAIDEGAIRSLAVEWAGTSFPLPEFNYPGIPVVRREDWWFDYVTLAVSVLACLWPPDDKAVWHVDYQGDWLDDAPGVFAAFTKVLGSEGVDLDWFANLRDEDGSALFAGRGTLQMIPDRVQTLRTVARQIQNRWDGSAANLVAAAGRDGREIVRLLIETSPAYVDRPMTSAGVANFDKLAHLAAAIMAAGLGWSDAGFSGYDGFPVYPDYMLPRVFREYGIMGYAPDLAELIDAQLLVPKDSNAEHGIRWATVYAGAQLSRALAAQGAVVTGPALDYRLWSIAVLGPDARSFGEHHRTVTLAY